MSYFSHCSTVEQIKVAYKKLAIENHPDRGGDSEVMKAINNAYTKALEGCNGQTSKGTDEREHTYKYDEAREQEIMEMIQKLIAIVGNSQIEIILIGRWIWLLGDTKPVKDQLKNLKCLWHRDRKCWFWRSADDRGHGKGGDLDQLAAKYGATDFGTKAKSTRKAVKSA